MTDLEKLVEAMAKAHIDAANKAISAQYSHLNLSNMWETLGAETQEFTRVGIRAALTAIEASGFRVVPVEPTLSMKGDAWRATLSPDGISAADIERIWKAMLAASPKVTP